MSFKSVMETILITPKDGKLSCIVHTEIVEQFIAACRSQNITANYEAKDVTSSHADIHIYSDYDNVKHIWTQIFPKGQCQFCGDQET